MFKKKDNFSIIQENKSHREIFLIEKADDFVRGASKAIW